MNRVLVIGAGGHAKVVADILLCRGIEVLGFLDDDPAAWGMRRLGLPVLGEIASYIEYRPDGLVMGIGSNAARKRVVEQLGTNALDLWRGAIHPSATISGFVRLGVGVVVTAGAVINPDTTVGDHAIVNTGATVDHDCKIGAFAHIAPGVHLCGGVSVGDGTLIGVGAVSTPCRSIGEWALVAAGAAVVGDIPDRVTARGVPAQW